MRKSGKKGAAVAAWCVYLMCTVMMLVMTWMNEWHIWVIVQLVVLLILVSFMTFLSGISVELQSYILTICAFSDIFTCSILEEDIYPSIIVLLAEAIMISIYKNEKLLFTQMFLSVLAIVCNVFLFRTVVFGSKQAVFGFIVRISVLIAAQIYLVVFIRMLNRSEENLRHSVVEARRAEHSKSDFLANMSHEIRTPMNAIIGMCELILREKDLSDSTRENCFNIQTAGRSLLSIINDILDFSKIESGKMELIHDEFNIASTLNDVINMAVARKGSKKIDIIVQAEPDIPRGLVGDEIRIRQVIINLITNAIKFTEKGSVTLVVSCTHQEYGANLFVSVIDTGIGITEENIEKLFTSFRQVDTKKNRSVEGTGLGLAISKRLIQAMGGFMSVKSEYGKGSEFRFVIPLGVSDSRPFVAIKEPEKVHAAACIGIERWGDAYRKLFDDMGEKLGVDFKVCKSMMELEKRAEQGEITHCFVGQEKYIINSDYYKEMAENTEVFVIQDRQEEIMLPSQIKCIYKPFYVLSFASALNHENLIMNLNRHADQDAHFVAPKARILIVDDNTVNLKVAAGLMRPYHMQIMTAESGIAAISMLRSKDIDLVFMDHMMPEMDGVETTQKIREMKDEYYKNLPIIALTANAVNGVREMFINAGFDDFLAKPIELNALDRILRYYLPLEYIQKPMTEKEPDKEMPRQDMRKKEGSALLDPDMGLTYTGGNMEVYVDILSIYAKKGKEKIRYIKELLEKKDYKNYVIEVHALKSTSLSIGAIRLSELAKKLELAGKSEDYGTVEKETGRLLTLYEEVVDTVYDYLGGPEEKEEEEEYTDLREMECSVVADCIRQAKEACEAFDGDTMEQLATQMQGYVFAGKRLHDYFGKAAEMAADFEYDDAAEVITGLENELQVQLVGAGTEEAENSRQEEEDPEEAETGAQEEEKTEDTEREAGV